MHLMAAHQRVRDDGGEIFPGRLLQASPHKRQGNTDPGPYALIDLDLSRYGQIAQRFSREQAKTSCRALPRGSVRAD